MIIPDHEKSTLIIPCGGVSALDLFNILETHPKYWGWKIIGEECDL